MATDNTSAERAPITPARYVGLLAAELHQATGALQAAAAAVQRDAQRLLEQAGNTSSLNTLGELQGRPSQAEAALGRVKALEDALDMALRMAPDWSSHDDWELFTWYASRTPRALRLAQRAGLDVAEAE